MSDPWAKFRTAPAPDATASAAQPGPPQPSAPAAGDPWAKFRGAPAPDAKAQRDPAAVKAEFSERPWYEQAGQAADDIVRLIANGATFGFADKAAGALNGTGTEAERAKSDEAKARAGGAGTVAEIGGAMATPVIAARAGMSLPAVASKLPGVVGAGARTGLAAAEGAGYGALDAAGNDRSISDGMLLGAIFGGAGNALGEAVSGGVNKLAGMFNAKPAVPTRDEILAQAKAAYDAADNSGVMYTPQAVDRLRNDVVGQLTDLGYDPALQPGAKAVLDRIEGLVGQNVTFKGLDTLRKVASGGYQVGNDKNNKAVAKIIESLDNVVANPQAGEFMGGNAQDAAGLVSTARDLWSRLAKGETIGEAVKRGDLNAASAGTGWNTENALRQALKSVALDEGATRGFTPDEIAALRTAIEGTPDQNALRLLGRLAPTGVISAGPMGGAGSGAALGGYLAGPVGAGVGAMAVPMVGIGARSAANRMQSNAIDNLTDIIMAGGSAAAVTPKPNLVQDALSVNKDDLLRAIFGGAQQQAGEANQRMRTPSSRFGG